MEQILSQISMIPIKIRQALTESTPVDRSSTESFSQENDLRTLVEAGIKVTNNNNDQNIHFGIF